MTLSGFNREWPSRPTRIRALRHMEMFDAYGRHTGYVTGSRGAIKCMFWTDGGVCFRLGWRYL